MRRIRHTPAREPYSYIDSTTPIKDVAGRNLPFPGLSPNNVNFVGYYEKGPVSVRLAYNWRDDYLIGLSAAATGIYNSPYTDLSATLRYDFSPSVSLGVEALNLLDEKQRTYDGVEFSISRRFSNRWFGQASYVYSRLYGNYAGIANSDEITSPTTNRTSAQAQQSAGNVARQGGNANRSWDLDEIMFDSKGNIVEGRLATDRPHVFKLFGSYKPL